MENEDPQTKETVNFWPCFSDMFLVLFVVAMVAFGAYKAQVSSKEKDFDDMQDVLIEQEASILLRLITGTSYSLFEDIEDPEKKTALAMKLYRAAKTLQRQGDKLNKDLADHVKNFNLSTEFHTDNYKEAILSFAHFVKIKDNNQKELKTKAEVNFYLENFRPDIQIKKIVERLGPGIGKKLLTKEELENLLQEKEGWEKILQDKETELTKAKGLLTEIQLNTVPVSTLTQCEQERDIYKRQVNQYISIFGELPKDKEKTQQQWDQVKVLEQSNPDFSEGTLILVDKQFKRALEMFLEATENKTVRIESPELIASAMSKLAENITGGQFDIVNSMLSESEVKFVKNQPGYHLIESVKSKNDFSKVYYHSSKAFADEDQWNTAQTALLKKVITGFDEKNGNTSKHNKGIIEMLKDHPDRTITVDIIGYTDSDGDAETNNDLGMRRAQFIANIIKILLQNQLESHEQLHITDSNRVVFRCLSAGKFGLLKQNPEESVNEYKARCRRIAVTVKVDSPLK